MSDYQKQRAAHIRDEHGRIEHLKTEAVRRRDLLEHEARVFHMTDLLVELDHVARLEMGELMANLERGTILHG